jgi:tRNA(Ile)-lysidine synthase
MNTKIQKKINLSIQPEGRFGSDGFNLTLNKIEVPFLNSNLYNEVIDAHYVLGKKLVLRSWSKGDRFNPMGMVGRKKVSDLLVDDKVDCFSKEKQLVLTANDEIIWVCGRRLSDTAKVTQFTTEYLELNLTSNVV